MVITSWQAPALTVSGETVETLPSCAGVYRFLAGDGQVLYVGKSVNIRNRVRSHFAKSSRTERKRRLLHATRSIDCRPTAGEAGALLLENLAIKQQLPVFNRRQRYLRRMWSITLERQGNQSLRPRLSCFSMDNPDVRAGYGSYANRTQARQALEDLARSEYLCAKVLGLEPGTGPCFQYQLGRCFGACVDHEPLSQHNARLTDALSARRLSAWPGTEPLLLHECAEAPLACQPTEEWHLLHNWVYLGTFASVDAARRAEGKRGFLFDRDTHRILRGVLRKGDLTLQCLDSGAAVTWQVGSHSRY